MKINKTIANATVNDDESEAVYGHFPRDVTSAKPNRDPIKSKIRQEVRGYYDIQKLRIAAGNRIVASIVADVDETKLPKVLAVKKPSKKAAAAVTETENVAATSEQSEVAEDAAVKVKVLKEILIEFKKVTEACISEAGKEKTVKSSIARLSSELAYVKSEMDYKMIEVYQHLVYAENLSLANVKNFVEEHPMHDAFFSKVKGCGPLMSAVCLAYFDIYEGRHISSFWKYAGLDVVIKVDDATGEITGEGRSKQHLVEQTYINREGESSTKLGISFQPELKAKLLGVLGGSFLKCRSEYSTFYYDYKNRLMNNPRYESHTPKHIHNMANRYMVKMFVKDLWLAWRKVEGLPIELDYAEAYLGRKPHGFNGATGNIDKA